MLPSSPSASMAKPYPALKLRNVLLVLAIAVAYLLLSRVLVGFHTDQLYVAGLFVAMYIASGATRRFALAFSIFIVYWIIFNYMKAFPNYWVNDVHIADLYAREKSLFGLQMNGTTITPNEYFQANHNTFLDVMTGCFYLCWVPVPLLVGVVLFFRNREQFFRFSLTFLLVNLVGFVIYYVYPAAPPWYVQQFGFTFRANTPGNTAGLHRFDEYFNAGIFKSLYEKSSNVFAAMPSLHSSYPLIVLYYGIKTRMRWLNVFFAVVMVGIWFSAVYTSHHYVLDVMAGIACAVFSIGLFSLLMKTWGMKRFVAMLMRVTTPSVKLKRKLPETRIKTNDPASMV
jgi:inositol phosphorylceramide synthase catalytic subunit